MDYRMTFYNTIIEKINYCETLKDGIEKDMLQDEIDEMCDTYRHMCFDFRDVVAEEVLPCVE